MANLAESFEALAVNLHVLADGQGAVRCYAGAAQGPILNVPSNRRAGRKQLYRSPCPDPFLPPLFLHRLSLIGGTPTAL